MPVPGSTVTSLNRNKTCPSPSFDARHLKNAKWSSTEDVSFKDPGSFKDLPQTWTPRNNPSPSPDKKDFKPVNFDSNSLKRSKRSISTDSGSTNAPAPTDSFAWKDTTLERQLKELNEKKFSDAPDPKAGREGANDKGLDKSLQNWASKPLPKAEDPDVILLKKARQEKKVKRYLEDNFQNREGNYTSEPESSYDSDIGALSSKYASLDRRRTDERSSPPKSPPPFSKAESRYEREQRIKVGSLDSYTPGSTLSREKSISPPPAVSAAQKKYERERFRVEPGRIENYTLGRGSLANQEVYKAGLASSASGCGITKYSSAHSFNPLLLSKSAHNLSVKKGSPSDGLHLQKTLKDGYESDSTLVYRKHHYNPCSSPSPQAKALYTQVQKGGDVPLQGLRMQAPEKQEEIVPSIQAFQRDTEHGETPRPTSSVGSTLRREQMEKGEHQTEEEIRIRQKQQLNQFYQKIDQQKETQLKVDLESRKHHDTLLPNQKSPVPLNRYEDQDPNHRHCQALFLNAGKKPDDCKMVAKALFSFQAQNNRELSFKKGDIIYIKKQVDGNWYEGERNAMMGIFPTTYVEIIPSDAVVTTLTSKERNYDGQAKARFNFTAQTPMELSLIKGEIVTLTRRIDKNWFEGKIGSRKGIIPVSYVEILSEPGEGTGTLTKPAAAPAAHSILKNGTLPQSSYIPVYDKPKSYTGSASPYSTLSRPGSSMSNGGHHNTNDGKPEPTPFRALYNYKPQNDDEVELCEGDIVYVMEKCDDGWFVGTSQRTGIFGTFPGNYVTHI